MTVTKLIRSAISESHAAIEATPFSVALMRGELDSNAYSTSIAQLWHIHAGVERSASAPVVAQLFQKEFVRTPAIERDLAHWNYSLRGVDVFQITKDIVTKIANLCNQQPIALLAHIYVLEGSRMGSMFIAKPLAASLGVQPMDGNGLDYHTEGMRETPARFGQFKGRLDAMVSDPKSIQLLCDSAVEFMVGLTKLYAELPTNRTARTTESRSVGAA